MRIVYRNTLNINRNFTSQWKVKIGLSYFCVNLKFQNRRSGKCLQNTKCRSPHGKENLNVLNQRSSANV